MNVIGFPTPETQQQLERAGDTAELIAKTLTTHEMPAWAAELLTRVSEQLEAASQLWDYLTQFQAHKLDKHNEHGFILNSYDNGDEIPTYTMVGRSIEGKLMAVTHTPTAGGSCHIAFPIATYELSDFAASMFSLMLDAQHEPQDQRPDPLADITAILAATGQQGDQQ